MASKPRKFVNAVAAVSKKCFYNTLSEPIDLLRDIAEEFGFDTECFEGIYCGRDGETTFEVQPRYGIKFTWHKMDVTGRYEIVAYTT